ncbi:MAG: ABC transporter permease subunit [Planctomycetota bacterium]
MPADSNPQYETSSVKARMAKNRMFLTLCLVAASAAILILIILLWTIFSQGLGRLSLDFLSSLGSKDAEKAGLLPPLVGSIFLLMICGLTAIPLGVGTAILLEEFRPKQKALATLHGFVQTNITNLAGVPSIVYGILGLTAFAQFFGVFNNEAGRPFAIGQTWYHQYVDLSQQSYFLPVAGPDATPEPAGPGLTLFTVPGGETVADIEYRPASDAQLLQVRTDIELANFDLFLKIDELLRETRTTRRGPVNVDQAKAEEIAATSLAFGDLKSDPEVAQEVLVSGLLALDGLRGREYRNAKSQITSDLADLEIAYAGLDGVMLVGTEPLVVAHNAWYHISLPFGRGLMAGGLTLMLVILPIIIIASQEALRAVPQTMRQGCLALGGTKWQAVQQVALPAAIPGICTGAILAMSRAIGEAAPILLIGAVFISFLPSNLMDGFSAMPLQIFNWSSRPQAEFKETAAAGIIVLLAVLLTFNGIAVWIRHKSQKNY